jgi:hypothetical protein
MAKWTCQPEKRLVLPSSAVSPGNRTSRDSGSIHLDHNSGSQNKGSSAPTGEPFVLGTRFVFSFVAESPKRGTHLFFRPACKRLGVLKWLGIGGITQLGPATKTSQNMLHDSFQLWSVLLQMSVEIIATTFVRRFVRMSQLVAITLNQNPS